MKLLIIDLYGDGESLRVCEDKAGIDQALTDQKFVNYERRFYGCSLHHLQRAVGRVSPMA